jgi:hypothetical protein
VLVCFQEGIVVTLLVAGMGCSAAVAPRALDEGLPLLVPRTLRPAPSEARGAGDVEAPEPTPPDDPAAAVRACDLEWTPRELRGSVLAIPAGLHGRMMAPLLRGLCACTRQGQILLVRTLFVPERGEVGARTADDPDRAARASRSIDACLARELGPRRFEPFVVGSDVVVECPPGAPGKRRLREPVHLAAPRPVGCGPPEERATRIASSLYVDRRSARPPEGAAPLP